MSSLAWQYQVPHGQVHLQQRKAPSCALQQLPGHLLPVAFRCTSSSNSKVASRGCRAVQQSGNRHSPTAVRSAINLDALALDVPEIDGDIKSIQVELGAIFNDAGLATTFKNKQKVLEALESGVVLLDRSHWGRIRVSGDDRISFLHNQSTNDFMSLKPGQGCETVFVTATARCIDLATCLVSENSVLVITSPGTSQALLQRFDKYTFPADKVKFHDVSSRTALITLLGPESENVLKELAGDSLKVLGAPPGSHQLLAFKRAPVMVISGSGLAVPGYTLLVDETIAGDVYAALAMKGCIPMGEEEWEAARILAGRPAVGSELTEDYNPLEAGLYHAVSVNKGCYIGQETLSKLNNLDGVKQQLWGLQLDGPAEPGAEISSALSKIGTLTSACQDAEGNWVGLGYMRCRNQGTQIALEGVKVVVGGKPATVTAIPYATRAFPGDASGKPADGNTVDERARAAKQAKADAEAAEQAAKAQKLREMQARLEAWKAQQAAAQQPQQ